jgi:hypothetical protein
MPRRLFALLLALGPLTACKDPSLAALPFTPNKGTVVLNGFGTQGMTLVPDTGTTTSFISLPATFDGAGMRVARDTALTTSSKGGGDQLYVVDLATGAKKAIQLPAASNPGGATLVVGQSTANIAVALRDSQAVAFITNLGSATPTVTLRRNVGTCPVDVVQFDVELYVLDANQNCRTDFSIVGPSRLLRLRFANSVIDTIPIGSTTFAATGMVQVGSAIYIGAFGNVNFGTGVVTNPGMLVKYDMDTRNILATATMPQNSFGTIPAPGRDGNVYAFVYNDASTFQGRVVRMDSTSLGTVAPYLPGTSFARLLAPDSTSANCAAVAVDTRGRLYCPVVGAAGASKMYVYNANYLLIRNLNVGQGAVAVQAR